MSEDSADTIETISATSDQSQAQVQLQIDDGDVPAMYCTTIRAWGSAQEINLDFAGLIRSTNQPKVARLKIDQRVILNPWADKRLAVALNQALARYEETFGSLEMDDRNRRAVGIKPNRQTERSIDKLKETSSRQLALPGPVSPHQFAPVQLTEES